MFNSSTWQLNKVFEKYKSGVFPSRSSLLLLKHDGGKIIANPGEFRKKGTEGNEKYSLIVLCTCFVFETVSYYPSLKTSCWQLCFIDGTASVYMQLCTFLTQKCASLYMSVSRQILLSASGISHC